MMPNQKVDAKSASKRKSFLERKKRREERKRRRDSKDEKGEGMGEPEPGPHPFTVPSSPCLPHLSAPLRAEVTRLMS
jgi:hypothetical protein